MPTKFAWSMPSPERVIVKIFDVRGHLVRTIIDEQLQSGRHEVIWNGKNRSEQPVAAGVYFAAISVGNNKTVQKVVRLRNN
jgi:flagellar hook assembly protein FlgD